MKKVVIITGLTASGKSSLALKLAQKFNGEIISCDSVQVYKRLDIGSAKESLENRQKIKHYLIDIVEPTVNYNVAMFVSDTQKSIDECIKKGKTPFIVGGTMMYIKALLEGYTLGGEANLQFREKWQQYAQNFGKNAVWEELNKLNPQLAQKVHFNNLNRVIRYLELATFGEPQKTQSILQNFDVLAVGINESKQSIYKKINSRVDNMISSGLEQEVSNLISAGLTLSNNSINSIGYREMYEFLTGKTDYNTCVDLIKQHTRNYAKRQLTFMKTIQNLHIVPILEAEVLINEFLSTNVGI